MWRSLVIRLDAFQFQRFHCARLALDIFFQPLQQFALLNDDAVQLLDLMFEMCDMRFEFFGAPGMFVCHAAILPARRREVETVSCLVGMARCAFPDRSGAQGGTNMESAHFLRSIPWPDAALGDADGAARRPYQFGQNQIADCAAPSFSQSYSK